jgi:nucleotide-binding universal stress UspA family protein
MSEIPVDAARDAAGRIVVGIDGSLPSEAALRWAVRQARLTGAHVDAVITWEWPLAYGVAPETFDEDFAGTAAEVLGTSVQNVVSAEDAGRVSRLVLRGHPAGALLDSSEGAALLVVGSRGHGGFSGMLLGSVSQHVVAHATCPVVVVHG